VKSETPARQVGPLKMARGFKGATYYCSTEVSDLLYFHCPSTHQCPIR
jgi:hypothetical protein